MILISLTIALPVATLTKPRHQRATDNGLTFCVSLGILGFWLLQLAAWSRLGYTACSRPFAAPLIVIAIYMSLERISSLRRRFTMAAGTITTMALICGRSDNWFLSSLCLPR
jgi:hypothetical protein